MHTKYDRYRRAPADAGQKEITERGVARCGVFAIAEARHMCLIRALSFAVFTHFRPDRRFEKPFHQPRD
jgi:hypothetical protein